VRLLGLPPQGIREKYRPHSKNRLERNPGLIIGADQLRLQREHLGLASADQLTWCATQIATQKISRCITPPRPMSPLHPVYDREEPFGVAASPPGLSIAQANLEARAPRWKTIFQIGAEHFPPATLRSMVEQLCQSAVESGQEVIEARKTNAAWRDVAKHWRTPGMQECEDITQPKGPHPSLSLDNAIARSWLLRPRKLQSLERVIGRSSCWRKALKA